MKWGAGVFGVLLLLMPVLAVTTGGTSQVATAAARSGGGPGPGGGGPGGDELNTAVVPPDYVALVVQAGSMCAGESAPLIAAQVEQESGWNPRAGSPAGAQGIAQFMPGTWSAWGADFTGDQVADVWNPGDAIPSQGRLMCALFAQVTDLMTAGRIGRGTAEQNALAAYNAGRRLADRHVTGLDRPAPPPGHDTNPISNNSNRKHPEGDHDAQYARTGRTARWCRRWCRCWGCRVAGVAAGGTPTRARRRCTPKPDRGKCVGGDCAGEVEVAVAVLAEASAAAPTGGVRVAAAAVVVARERAEQLSRAVATARDAVDDAADELEVLTTESAVVTTAKAEPDADSARRGSRSWARRRRQERVLAAAREELVVAEETRAAAEVALAAAEEALAAARQAPALEPSMVIAARVRLAAARQALATAEDDPAARLNDGQPSHLAGGPGRSAAQATSAGSASAEAGPTGEAVVVVPFFSGVEAFVEGFVLPNWRHGSGAGVRWCRQWWKHPEAVGRLEALWEAFEAMRLQPAPAISSWWLHHFDPHLRALTAGDGVFAGCTATERESVHSPRPDWPAMPPIPGLFEADPDSPARPGASPATYPGRLVIASRPSTPRLLRKEHRHDVGPAHPAHSL